MALPRLKPILIRPSISTKLVSKLLYRYLATKMPTESALVFMNYGFAALNGSGDVLNLAPSDVPYRYHIQLYHSVIANIPLAQKDVLEVGCGRGGGASFVQRYLNPGSLVAVDFDKHNIDLCNQRLPASGISFRRDDAERLSFPDQSFDVVINIESSHCYSSIERFFTQVSRVLRPGGQFLYADLRWVEDMPAWEDQIRRSGLTLLEKVDITPNVLRSLELDEERKLSALRTRFGSGSRAFKRWAGWAGMRGSSVYNSFSSRQLIYQRAVLRKASP